MGRYGDEVMSEFKTMKDFAAKVDWEGGAFGAMQYGLFAEDIPDDGSEESQTLYTLWDEASTAIRLFDEIDTILRKYQRDV